MAGEIQQNSRESILAFMQKIKFLISMFKVNVNQTSKKVRWFRAQDLFGSRFKVTTKVFELQISCI